MRRPLTERANARSSALAFGPGKSSKTETSACTLPFLWEGNDQRGGGSFGDGGELLPGSSSVDATCGDVTSGAATSGDATSADGAFSVASAGLTSAGLTSAGLTSAGLTAAGLTAAGLTSGGAAPAGVTSGCR